MNEIVFCCAECGGVAGEGISLKMCKSCMSVRYCNAECQRNHWPKHKTECKLLVYSLCSLRRKVLNEMLSLMGNKWQVSYSIDETNVPKEEDEQRKEYVMLRLANN
jgi:hypothetical protein